MLTFDMSYEELWALFTDAAAYWEEQAEERSPEDGAHIAYSAKSRFYLACRDHLPKHAGQSVTLGELHELLTDGWPKS